VQLHALAVLRVLAVPRRAGALDVEAAKALGVLPGRSFGELKAGRAVQTVSGDWVQPEQVLYPNPDPHRHMQAWVTPAVL